MDGDTVAFEVYGDKNVLAQDREEGFQLFHSPDERVWTETFQQDFIAEVDKRWKKATAERRLLSTVIARLEEHLEFSKKGNYLAHRDKRDALALYFQDEREMIEGLIETLKMKS